MAVGQGGTNMTSLSDLIDVLNGEDLLPTAADGPANPGNPGVYKLEQNYPNPFNASTTIKYSVSENSFVELTIYNILGEKVKTIVRDSKPAGSYTIVWDGTDHDNNTLPSGIYFYRLQAGDFTSTNRMILMK
jgi:hypothetical protein